MHQACYEFVGRAVQRYGLASLPTLEVGSQIVNGSVRGFWNGPYVGVDVVAGNGVDRVENAENLSDADNTWACVISTEALEHVDRPWRFISELARVAAPKATIIVTARGYDSRGCWEVHSWPHDVTRFSERGMRVMAEDAGLEVLETSPDPEGPGFFMVCQKP